MHKRKSMQEKNEKILSFVLPLFAANIFGSVLLLRVPGTKLVFGGGPTASG
jgi:hypothetical protein